MSGAGGGKERGREREREYWGGGGVQDVIWQLDPALSVNQVILKQHSAAHRPAASLGESAISGSED